MTGARHGGKSSRSWSFVPPNAQALPRGVNRTWIQACLAGTSWSHEWFATLSEKEQSSVRETFPPQPVPPPEEEGHRGVRRPADVDIGNDRQRQRVAE